MLREGFGKNFRVVARFRSDQDLNIRCCATQFVLRLLSDDRRENRQRECRELREQAQSESDFFAKIHNTG